MNDTEKNLEKISETSGYFDSVDVDSLTGCFPKNSISGLVNYFSAEVQPEAIYFVGEIIRKRTTSVNKLREIFEKDLVNEGIAKIIGNSLSFYFFGIEPLDSDIMSILNQGLRNPILLTGLWCNSSDSSKFKSLYVEKYNLFLGSNSFREISN